MILCERNQPKAAGSLHRCWSRVQRMAELPSQRTAFRARTRRTTRGSWERTQLFAAFQTASHVHSPRTRTRTAVSVCKARRPIPIPNLQPSRPPPSLAPHPYPTQVLAASSLDERVGLLVDGVSGTALGPAAAADPPLRWHRLSGTSVHTCRVSFAQLSKKKKTKGRLTRRHACRTRTLVVHVVATTLDRW